MLDTKKLLERVLETATSTSPSPSDDFARFVRYRERRRRNERLVAGAFALALAVAVIGSALAALRPSEDRRPGHTENVVPVDPGINQACGPSDACWDADVFTMTVHGATVTRLGYDEERDFGYSWSPDGQRIAFYRGVGIEGGGRFDADWNVFTMAVDGSDIRQLTDASGVAGMPVYSPDGSRIAFMGERDGVADVWVMDADGSDPVNITDFDDSTLDDYHPTWSPDGEQIAFVRGRVPPGGPGKLRVIDADGSHGRVLLDSPLAMFPAWSPDGTRIAF
jgi:TolB protein